MVKQFLFVCTLIGCLLAIGGCDDTDIGSIEISLKADGSGDLTVVRVMNSSTDASASDIQGVNWDSSASLVVTKGSFQQLSSLKFGEVTFEMKDHGFLRVELPRGADVVWPTLLTVFDTKDRATLKDNVKKTSVGTLSMNSVKIVLNLAKKPISCGVAESVVLGLSPSIEKQTVTLNIPLDLIRAGGHPIVWDITW